jgi:predicted metalloprotease with PDZ domain
VARFTRHFGAMFRIPTRKRLAILPLCLIAGLASAQTTPADPPPAETAPAPPAAIRSAPQGLPVIATVPTARDIPWSAGTIQLEVDATDTLRRIVQVKQTVPVTGDGPLTLLLPKWLPGKHAPRGAIDKVAGLVIATAAGEPVRWQRDPLDVHAIHIAAPPGAGSLVLRFQFLAPTLAEQGRITMTDSLLDLQWENVAFYPAGFYVRNIPIAATLTVPQGWTTASALRGVTDNDGSASVIRYGATDFETLIDSPVFAGRHARTIDLGHDVALHVFADDPAELLATPDQIATHKQLVAETLALFGARHFDHYDFLLALSDTLGSIGLEHHRSSENGVRPGYFTKWNDGPGDRNILPHEFTHSWNGKFRRPDLLWTPDYQTPMQDELLWVYEGQTQFWGYVLGARAGLFSKLQTLDALASAAARLDTVSGRQWRPLQDTSHEPIISARRPEPWRSWQRAEDYYNEGMLIWLEADAILRRESKGAKGMDDFARAFFGMKDGDWGQLLYNRQDVIATLATLVPYDWAGFLAERVDRTNDAVGKAGFTLGGYRLVYGDTPGSAERAREQHGSLVDQSFGVGLTVSSRGAIQAVVWDSAAFKAGLAAGMEIVAVNDIQFSPEEFRRSLAKTIEKDRPLSLIVKHGQRYRMIRLDYSGGIRYPRLEKIGEDETSLDRLLEPRTGEAHVAQPKSAGTP